LTFHYKFSNDLRIDDLNILNNQYEIGKGECNKMPTLELIAQIESLQKENKELKEQVTDLEFIVKALDGELSKYTKIGAK
jgi:cell division protein FtsB